MVSETVHNLFVYGSLMTGQRAFRIWPCQAARIEAGMIVADLYDLGPYPGIVHGSGRVLGELHFIHDSDWQETLEELDAFEEYDPTNPDAGLYLRELVEVDLAGRSEQAWVYFLKSATFVTGLGRTYPRIEENAEFHGRTCASWAIHRIRRDE